MDSSAAVTLPIKVHPAAECFPKMSKTDMDNLCASIRTGFDRDYPIVVTEDGLLVDGRHRLDACSIEGVKPVIRTKHFASDQEIAEYVGKTNLARRHLTTNAKAKVGMRLANVLNGTNRHETKVGPSQDGPTIALVDREKTESLNHNTADVVPKTSALPGVTQSQAAAIVGISPAQIQRRKLLEKYGDPQLIEAADRSEFSLACLQTMVMDRRVPRSHVDQVNILRERQREKLLAKPALRRDGRAGCRVVVPEGKTLESWVREIMVRQDTEKLSDQVATAAAGIHAQTFALVRDIVLLADRTDLSERDHKVLVAALANVNERRQVRRFYNGIRPLVERIWGQPKTRHGNHSRRQIEEKRLAAFAHACGVIGQVCGESGRLEIPYLTTEQIKKFDRDLARAMSEVRKLRKRMQESAHGEV